MTLPQTILVSFDTIAATTILMLFVLLIGWKLAQRSARREHAAQQAGKHTR